MADGWHGSMPASVFKDLVCSASCRSRPLIFEVSRLNNYRNAGLYRESQDGAPPEHIMGVTLHEFPERTVRDAEGGIEALGWREALTTLISDRIIEPTDTIRMWLGTQGVAHALSQRKSEGLVAAI